MTELERTPEVEQAERDVERRKRDLARSLQRVEASSERLAQRLRRQLKPVLIGAAVVAGAAVVVGGAVLARRRRLRPVWQAPAQPSLLGAVTRSVGLGLLRLAVRHVAQTVAQRLVAVPPDQVEGGSTVVAEQR